MKKMVSALLGFALIFSFVFANAKESVLYKIEEEMGNSCFVTDAPEITGNKKADIYSSIKIAEELPEKDIPYNVNLLSEVADTFEYTGCDESLNLIADELSGDVSVYFNSDKSYDDAYIYMGIFEGERLVYFDKSNTPVSSTQGYADFNDVWAEVNDGKYILKFYAWDKNNSPIANVYEYDPATALKLYADEVIVSGSAESRNGEIMVDMRVFGQLGAICEYDSENSVIWIGKNNEKVGMYLYDSELYVFKGSTRYTESADCITYVKNSNIYVPARAICKVFNFIISENGTKIKFYSNEVLKAEYSTNFDVSTEAGALYHSRPDRDFYSAQINNGLVYFVAPGSNYIYVTNGSSTIKYNAGGTPRYVLSEGDYIYYSINTSNGTVNGNTIYRIDKNTNVRKKLFSFSSYLWNDEFSYYNGNIYIKGSSEVYSASTGSRVASYNRDNHGNVNMDYATIVIGKDTVCNVVAEHFGAYTLLSVKTADKFGTISSATYKLYGKSATYNRDLASVYNTNGVYVKVKTLLPTGADSIRIVIDGENKISSVTEISSSQWEKVCEMEEYTHSKFATTRITNDYRFIVDDNVITAIDRETEEAIGLLNLGNISNKLLFADDSYLIYCVYGIGIVSQDGRSYYRYTGETRLQMLDIYEGATMTLYST